MKCSAFSFAVVLFAVFMAYTSATTTMMDAPSTYVMSASSMNTTATAAAPHSPVTHSTSESATPTPTSSAVNFAPSVLAMVVALLFATLK